jgi:hypothetical protein
VAIRASRSTGQPRPTLIVLQASTERPKRCMSPAHAPRSSADIACLPSTGQANTHEVAARLYLQGARIQSERRSRGGDKMPDAGLGRPERSIPERPAPGTVRSSNLSQNDDPLHDGGRSRRSPPGRRQSARFRTHLRLAGRNAGLIRTAPARISRRVLVSGVPDCHRLKCHPGGR